MGSIGRGLVGCMFAAIVASALWTCVSYATTWSLGGLAILVGAAAGLGMASASKGGGGIGGGLLAALVALVAMVGGRYTLVALEVADLGAEICVAEPDDAVALLAERIIEAEPDGLAEARNPWDDEGEIPPAIWSKAERVWDRMSSDEQEEMLAAIESNNRAEFDQAAPVWTGIAMVVRIGFFGLISMGLGMGLALKLGCAGSSVPTPTAASVTETAGETRRPAGAGVPAGRAHAAKSSGESDSIVGLRGFPKVPDDPLAGTEIASRSLTGGAPPAASASPAAAAPTPPPPPPPPPPPQASELRRAA